MYIEKRYLRKIAKVFQELSLPLRLLDADGVCIVPEEKPPAGASVTTANVSAAVMAAAPRNDKIRFFSMVLPLLFCFFLIDTQVVDQR